jgi:hypothetical protein
MEKGMYAHRCTHGGHLGLISLCSVPNSMWGLPKQISQIRDSRCSSLCTISFGHIQNTQKHLVPHFRSVNGWFKLSKPAFCRIWLLYIIFWLNFNQPPKRSNSCNKCSLGLIIIMRLLIAKKSIHMISRYNAMHLNLISCVSHNDHFYHKVGRNHTQLHAITRNHTQSQLITISYNLSQSITINHNQLQLTTQSITINNNQS